MKYAQPMTVLDESTTEYILKGKFEKDCKSIFADTAAYMISSELITGSIYFLLIISTTNLIIWPFIYDSNDGIGRYIVLALSIFNFVASNFIRIRYIRLRDILPAVWYFKAFSEEYDKNNALYKIITESCTVIHGKFDKDNRRLMGKGNARDFLFIYHWITAIDGLNNVIGDKPYKKWKQKYFHISNYPEMIEKIFSMLLFKTAELSSGKFEYYDEMDDDAMKRIFVDSYNEFTEREIKKDSMVFNIFKDSLGLLIETVKKSSEELDVDRPAQILNYIDHVLAPDYVLNHETYDIKKKED